MQVITLITRENRGWFKLKRSAEKFGWPLKTVFLPNPLAGRDGSYAQLPEDPTKFAEAYSDFICTKHLLIRKHLQPFGQFLYVDGWDCVFLRPYAEWPRDFEGLWFSGQREAWPEKGYQEYFEKRFVGDFPAPNTGVIWGDAAAYHARCPSAYEIDQLLWHRKISEGTSGISVDSRAEYVATLDSQSSQSDWTYNKGSYTYTRTSPHTAPFIAHLAGKSAALAPEFI